MKQIMPIKKILKTGQVSIEFLTTYGWAFMVALIAIGALAYFGVLNPSKYTPDKCTFGHGIACNDFRIENNHLTMPNRLNNVTIMLTNNLGSLVNVSTLTFTDTSKTKYSCGGTSLSKIWPSGDLIEFTCQRNSGYFVKGNKHKIIVTLKYYNPASGPSYTQTINGELYSQIQ